MTAKSTPNIAGLALFVAVLGAPALALGWNPKVVANDARVRMPGTQTSQGVATQPTSACTNCHFHYDAGVEPGFVWNGSMMAQAGRDPFFWGALTVAAQDSINAFG